MIKIIEPEVNLFRKPFEPKVNDRFVVYMEDIPTYVIKSVIRPIASVKDNSYIYSDLILEMYDPIYPSTSQKIFDYIRANKTEFDEIKLDILGPIGDVVEQWLFKKCKVVSIEYSKLDWSDGCSTVIRMTLTPNKII
jgi:hypothetical protein